MPTASATGSRDLNGFADHDELSWNAVGTHWEVPIEQASVRVPGAGGHRPGGLLVGPVGSDRACAASDPDGRTAAFATTGLGPNEGVMVVVGFPTGVVPAPGRSLPSAGAWPRRSR